MRGKIRIADTCFFRWDGQRDWHLSKVFRSFCRWLSGRTVILISHRFFTVRMADRIDVLKQGNISEGSRHEELIKHQSAHADRFEIASPIL